MDTIIARGASFLLRSTACRVPRISLVMTRYLCNCDATQRYNEVYDTKLRWRIAADARYLRSNLVVPRIPFSNFLHYGTKDRSSDETKRQSDACPDTPLPTAKQNIFQRMKQLTKDYWHILIPVHVATSVGWISIFYTAAKNGVDIVSILESINLSERYLDLVRGSSAGHWAVTYALYKVFTPIRYMVTVGGTTLSIRYLNKWGYLKFKPRATIKEMQSSNCAVAAEHREKLVKTTFKNQQQTEPPTKS